MNSQSVRPAELKREPVLLSKLGEASDDGIAAEIAQHVAQSKRIVITGHERPDGDCIGSEVALCAALLQLGKDARIINSDATPKKYLFLEEGVAISRAAEPPDIAADLVFVLDSTDLSRIGRIKKEHFKNAVIIELDHHLGNPNFGAVNWVDTKAAAAGELVWRLAACCGWKMPYNGLVALYTALMTDTGQFAYSNTTPRVLRMAAELVEKCVDPEAVWQRIYLNKSREELELESRARASMQCSADGKICSIALTHKDFQSTGTGPQNAEELVGIPRSLAGVHLSLFFYEINGGSRTKISLRSTRDLDARALAQKFGGGGHRQAAGCSIDLPISESRPKFLAEAEKFIAESCGE